MRRLVRCRSATPTGRPPRREHVGLLQDECGRLGDRRPGERGADPPGLGARGGELLRSLDVAADGVGERSRIVERNEQARAGGEHVLRVPVRRRDDGAAGGDREGERARGDLLAVAVRRHEDVGRGEQVGELVDREEAVVELDVLAETELEHAPFEHQAVSLALPTSDVRMGAARR